MSHLQDPLAINLLCRELGNHPHRLGIAATCLVFPKYNNGQVGHCRLATESFWESKGMEHLNNKPKILGLYVLCLRL